VLACSNITPVEELLKGITRADDATGVTDLGGIRLKRRSGRESSQHPTRFAPSSTNDTIPAQLAPPAPDRVGGGRCGELLEPVPAETVTAFVRKMLDPATKFPDQSAPRRWLAMPLTPTR
jgi:hypothetical protein